VSGGRISRSAAVAVAAILVGGAVGPARAGGAGHLLRRLNRARLAAHVPALHKNPPLTAVARRHSKDMAREHSLEKPAPSEVPVDAQSYQAFVGMGPTSIRMARIMLRGPERRSSLLDVRWTDVGVGVARDHRGRRWATLILANPSTSEWGVRESRPDPPPAPAGVMIPASIPSDCSRDVTSDLNAWIGSVPDGSTLVFQRHGCYRVERTIEVRDRHGLTFFGNGAYFKRFELSPPQLRYPNANAHWRFVGGSNITVQWLGVEGTNTVPDHAPGFGSYKVDFEFEHAFAFHGVTGVRLENAWADAVWGDGILLSGGDQYAPGANRNVVVSGFVVDRNGRQGVALSNIDGGLLERVEIWHGRRAGFDLEPPPGTVRNVEIRDSYTNALGLAFASAGVGDVSHIDIHHNRIDGSSVPWVYVKDSLGGERRDWSVHDNVVLQPMGSPMPMLYFVNVDNVDVRRNLSHSGTADVYSRLATMFKDSGGTLAVVDNDFTGACSAYVTDGATAPVVASGNLVSSC
jgi:Cysteine-rich secretory protein family